HDNWSEDIAGKRLRAGGHVAVKEAVFPFARFPGVDPILSPEMKSTGEVMGLDSDFGRAFAKSQLGSGTNLPLEGCVFVSVRDQGSDDGCGGSRGGPGHRGAARR